MRVIAQSLQSNSPGAAQVDKAAPHIGAIAFVHRFGSSLNHHVHFHVCVVDGVFEQVAGEGDADVDVDVQASPPGIVFHPATTAHPSPLWCDGTGSTTALCGQGAGTGRTGAAGCGAGRVSHNGGGRTWVRTAG